MNVSGVESMQAKWEEMFGERKEEVVEEVKIKKPRKKAVAKKTVKKVTENKKKGRTLKTRKRKATT